MATGTVLLTPEMATPGDFSTGNLSPAQARLQGSQSNPKLHKLVLAFDGAGSVAESVHFNFIVPDNYASGGTLEIIGTINSTTGNVAVMQAQVSCVSPADADTPMEHAYSAAATVSITANTTEARRLLTGAITLNMDSAAPGDHISIKLFRDPAHASDTHTSDFEYWSGEFQYTTS